MEVKITAANNSIFAGGHDCPKVYYPRVWEGVWKTHSPPLYTHRNGTVVLTTYYVVKHYN